MHIYAILIFRPDHEGQGQIVDLNEHIIKKNLKLNISYPWLGLIDDTMMVGWTRIYDLRGLVQIYTSCNSNELAGFVLCALVLTALKICA
jgi:hypothetical protein